MESPVNKSVLEALRALDTPTVCNAMEIVMPERRGYGYTSEPLVCVYPDLPPMVGFARTAMIRAAQPSRLPGEEEAALRDTYYDYIHDGGPLPSISVIQDLDNRQAGYGSFWGEVNSNIHSGLGCLGVVTSGCIRDVGDNAEGFQMLARQVSPSHAFVHLVNYGAPVDVAGMTVASGDLIHADRHGAIVIPIEAAAEIPKAAALIAKRERVIIEAARQPRFDGHKLREARRKASQITA